MCRCLVSANPADPSEVWLKRNYHNIDNGKNVSTQHRKASKNQFLGLRRTKKNQVFYFKSFLPHPDFSDKEKFGLTETPDAGYFSGWIRKDDDRQTCKFVNQG